MNQTGLTERIRSYFERRIAWTQGAIEELSRLDADLAAQDFDRLTDEHARREAQAESLAREHRGLLDEWRRAENVDEAERHSVGQFAQQAKELTEELCLHLDQADTVMQREAAGRKESLAGLRRGRRLLDKYRPGNPDDIGFIDKRA